MTPRGLKVKLPLGSAMVGAQVNWAAFAARVSTVSSRPHELGLLLELGVAALELPHPGLERIEPVEHRVAGWRGRGSRFGRIRFDQRVDRAVTTLGGREVLGLRGLLSNSR